MRKWLGWIAIAWLLGLCAVALVAYGGQARAGSLDDRARAVALQLRCPVCQGESVADSPSDIAKAMRRDIRSRLARGESPNQIKTFYASRYGNWILLSPPSSGVGGLAWLAPPLLVIGGIGLLFTLVVDWRSRGRSGAQAGSARYVERIRAELEDGSVR